MTGAKKRKKPDVSIRQVNKDAQKVKKEVVNKRMLRLPKQLIVDSRSASVSTTSSILALIRSIYSHDCLLHVSDDDGGKKTKSSNASLLLANGMKGEKKEQRSQGKEEKRSMNTSRAADRHHHHHLILGINAVTKALERGQCVAFAVCAGQTVQPPLLVAHLPYLAQLIRNAQGSSSNIIASVPYVNLNCSPAALGACVGLNSCLTIGLCSSSLPSTGNSITLPSKQETTNTNPNRNELERCTSWQELRQMLTAMSSANEQATADAESSIGRRNDNSVRNLVGLMNTDIHTG